MGISGCRGTGKDVPDGHTRDKTSGQAGTQVGCHDQGPPADGTRMGLKPGVGVGALLNIRCIGNDRRLTIVQEFATLFVGRLLRAGIQPIMPHGLIMGRGNMQ